MNEVSPIRKGRPGPLVAILSLALILLLFTGCAEAVSVEECVNTEPYGFWSGLWHGRD